MIVYIHLIMSLSNRQTDNMPHTTETLLLTNEVRNQQSILTKTSDRRSKQMLKVSNGLCYIKYTVYSENSQRSGSTHTHTRLTALFRDYPGEPVPER